MVYPLPVPTPLSSRFSSPTLSIAIDVNAAWKLYPMLPKGCYRYRDTNHLVKDCPYQMDMRLLMAEQQKELIEDLLVLKDIVLEEENPSAEEDFV